MARVVVLTPNPAVDVTYRVAAQVVGETVRVQTVARRAGGKGINVVRVLRQLGVDSMALQPLGGPTGEWIRTQLVSDGIASISVHAPHETRTTVAVVDDVVHPTLFSESGGPLNESAWTGLLDAIRQNCEMEGFLVIAGSFPPGTTSANVMSVVSAGHDAGALVIVDTSGISLLAAADAGADYITPNEGELLEATRAGTLDEGLSDLLARGARSVIVSRGASGMLFASADGGRESQRGVPGVTGNPTGAGDAATAGLVFALTTGLSPSAALTTAAIVGAAAVLSPVAGEIRLRDLPELATQLHEGPLPRPSRTTPFSLSNPSR